MGKHVVRIVVFLPGKNPGVYRRKISGFRKLLVGVAQAPFLKKANISFAI
ncbi:MAG: hypothetical protein ACLFQV_00800 [Vulcanimicrobiota bacterium]